MVSLYLHAYIRNNTKQSSRWLHIARNNRNLQQHEMLMPHDDPTLVCSANDLPHLNHSYDSGAFQIESKLEAILTMLQERFWAKVGDQRFMKSGHSGHISHCKLHQSAVTWCDMLEENAKRSDLCCCSLWHLFVDHFPKNLYPETLVRQQLTLKQESYGKPGFFYWKPFQIFQILPA